MERRRFFLDLDLDLDVDLDNSGRLVQDQVQVQDQVHVTRGTRSTPRSR